MSSKYYEHEEEEDLSNEEVSEEEEVLEEEPEILSEEDEPEPVEIKKQVQKLGKGLTKLKIEEPPKPVRKPQISKTTNSKRKEEEEEEEEVKFVAPKSRIERNVIPPPPKLKPHREITAPPPVKREVERPTYKAVIQGKEKVYKYASSMQRGKVLDKQRNAFKRQCYENNVEFFPQMYTQVFNHYWRHHGKARASELSDNDEVVDLLQYYRYLPENEKTLMFSKNPYFKSLLDGTIKHR